MAQAASGGLWRARARPTTPPELGDSFALVRYMTLEQYPHMDSLYKLHNDFQWISPYDTPESMVLGASGELWVEPGLSTTLWKPLEPLEPIYA